MLPFLFLFYPPPSDKTPNSKLLASGDQALDNITNLCALGSFVEQAVFTMSE
ncbi:hypothetical protein [Pseudobacteriovorax antillogorgiicola]|uniref:Uncharacterized protein n=1 Tax=Pseudobacteriovorax antillogorgiicola TaxID=1513793 RepID=A0A1Y6CS22_9BACT|nr:hypothetical protein [Pseudobacteriovorax antillogorgiicola]TCS41180.1 hypothetical protein EDD56_1509 [Pseudobacteriovorax antillogorgiicola]SMF83884.1 hypothetical protein SAMN06296036_1505 [Pseudobacteriovorax antillogorgiicola]